MIIKYLPLFIKHYKKRIATNNTVKKHFEERVKQFAENKNNPLLRDHALSGDMKGFRAFSITGDVRVVYKTESKNVVLFYDTGTHNQVYK